MFFLTSSPPQRWGPPRPLLFLPAAVVLLLSLAATPVHSVAVMSIDLGSEWMKVAVVTPGVPMEIALNPESKRKTATVVTIRGTERTFGSDALSSGIKYPESCYFYLLDLLGKRTDHPIVLQFRQRFPYYDIKPHPETGTVMFQHDKDTVYTVEELMAMVLQHARQIGEDFTDQKVKDAVITVPVYFNQAERRALLHSADLAGINVLQLITEPMAVALNYGMFRRKEVNATVKHLMFYDMGAQDTTVSIVAYQMVKTKERGFTETHPQAQVLGVGYDRHLGGINIQFTIRDFLADKFNALGKTKTDVRKVPRAMSKIFKEAGRVKTVLSANTHTYAQIENVMEEIDFRMEVTRDEFLKLNSAFFERVTEPVAMALKSAAMTMDEIHEVILVGAGTRIPKVQENLQAFLGAGKELGKNLNTDESAAMGAVYKAADLSTGFKVKKFITKDAVIFPIDVDFKREYESDEGDKGVKQVKRSLFAKMNPFPQKKIMTFNKHVDDFTFYVNLNDLDHLGDGEIGNIGSLNLTEVDVTGVAEALDKYASEANVESKGVKAHFNLDDSGFLNVTAVESIFEKTISAEEQEAEEEKKLDGDKDKKGGGEADGDKKDDSWANLGDKISSFFNKEKGQEEGKTEKKDGDKEKKGDKDKKEDKEKKDDKDKKDDKEKKEKKKEPKKPKIETLKEPLEFKIRIVDQPNPSEKLVAESQAKLKALNDRDEVKKKKETALNNLESFVIDVRDKLYQDIYEASSTEDEREKITAKCSEISDWIDEEATPETEVDVLEAKLKELKDLTSSWFARVREHIDRPEALGALKQMLNSSTIFLGKAMNKTGEDGFFTVAELELLEKKLDEVSKWKEAEEAAQEKQPKNEMPKMTTTQIAEKAMELDREVKYLLNKARIAQAEKEREKRKKEMEEMKAKEDAEKAKKKAKKDKKKAEGGNATNTDGEEEPAAEEEKLPGDDNVKKTPTEEEEVVEETEGEDEPSNDEGAEMPEVLEEEEEDSGDMKDDDDSKEENLVPEEEIIHTEL